MTNPTGQNVTIVTLTTATAVTASGYFVPIMATTSGAVMVQASLTQVQNAIGIAVGTGVPTATTYTHPTLFMRTDGTATNNRLYISTSTGGWSAVLTAS